MFDKEVSLADKALLHAITTWHDVLSGHSSLSQKIEFGAEALAVAGAAVVLHKLGAPNESLRNLNKSIDEVGEMLSKFGINDTPTVHSKDLREAFYAPHSPIIRSLHKTTAIEANIVDKKRL